MALLEILECQARRVLEVTLVLMIVLFMTMGCASPAVRRAPIALRVLHLHHSMSGRFASDTQKYRQAEHKQANWLDGGTPTDSIAFSEPKTC